MNYRLFPFTLLLFLVLPGLFPSLRISQSVQAVTVGNNMASKLYQIGKQELEKGQYEVAISTLQKALLMYREIGDRQQEGLVTDDLGEAYLQLGNLEKALSLFQQALTLHRQMNNRAGEGDSLANIGTVYYQQRDYQKALEFYQQGLALLRDGRDSKGQAITLNNIGEVYFSLEQYSKALEVYQQALKLLQRTRLSPDSTLSWRELEAKTLNNIGAAYRNLGRYTQALQVYQEALESYRQTGNKRGEGTALNNMGLAYNYSGQFAKALDAYQKALTIRRQNGDFLGESTTLNNIGLTYSNLGQYSKALELYHQALTLRKQSNFSGQLLGQRLNEGNTLNNMGLAYRHLGQIPKALEAFHQALVFAKQTGNRTSEGTTLNNLGAVYRDLKQYPQALEHYQKALVIAKEVGDRPGEGTTLNNLGGIYRELGQVPKALEYYQRALLLVKEVGDRPSEGITLSNLGFLLADQKRVALAIVFFKESVSAFEEIREQLRVLPKEQQKSYTETISSTYRYLADLLLKQDRVLEAQQVLDLLKIQEVEDYLRNVRGPGSQFSVLRSEQEILKQYNALQQNTIRLGQELSQLRKIPRSSLTNQQQQRLIQLTELEEKINQQFNQFIDSPEILKQEEQLSRTARQQNIDLRDLDALRNNLRQFNAVLFYPLILEDRLELVITTPDSPPLRRTVNVKREEFNRAIAEFHTYLRNPAALRKAKESGQKFYGWLIQPLEMDLKSANTKTIIYAPDGQLRYIPLSALYDGQQWLVERFRINNITAKSLTKFNQLSLEKPRALAGAFVHGRYEVPTGNQRIPYAGLPFAAAEIESLASQIPGTTKLVDAAFNLKTVKPLLNQYTLLHFATHAAFVPDEPKDSFILFGDGERATLRDIENWSLHNVDLVVLSACQTALGGRLGNGEEILGLGYQFQNRGVKATIATLWSVQDDSTSVLMSAFYASLRKGLSKVEALQSAQVELLESGNYRHPLYWAPFILIGNGL